MGDDIHLEFFFPVFKHLVDTACALLPQKYILLLVLPWQHCVLLTMIGWLSVPKVVSKTDGSGP